MEVDRMTNYNDGKWHGWNGGDCPVHPESVVDMVWPSSFNTSDALRAKRKAKEFTWKVSDAIAPSLFRVVKEHREPREFWLSKHNHGYILAHKPESNDPKDFIHVREVIE